VTHQELFGKKRENRGGNGKKEEKEVWEINKFIKVIYYLFYILFKKNLKKSIIIIISHQNIKYPPIILFNIYYLGHVSACQWNMFDATSNYEPIRNRNNMGHTISRVQNSPRQTVSVANIFYFY
jgi:hypothetical protein